MRSLGQSRIVCGHGGDCRANAPQPRARVSASRCGRASSPPSGGWPSASCGSRRSAGPPASPDERDDGALDAVRSQEPEGRRGATGGASEDGHETEGSLGIAINREPREVVRALRLARPREDPGGGRLRRLRCRGGRGGCDGRRKCRRTRAREQGRHREQERAGHARSLARRVHGNPAPSLMVS